MAKPAPRSNRLVWSLAAGAVFVVGLGLRLALGSGGVGDRSAMVMAALLSVGVWLAVQLLSTPRTAFLVTLGLVTLLDLAALPARNAPPYDDREAFFRTDQVLAAHVALASPLAQPVLVLLVEPVFPSGAAQPRFGLAGDVGGTTALAWACPFRRGMQEVVLPLPAPVLAGSGPIDVRLRLTGSPSRETDYLLAYASAPRGGFLVSLVDAAGPRPGATICALSS